MMVKKLSFFIVLFNEFLNANSSEIRVWEVSFCGKMIVDMYILW